MRSGRCASAPCGEMRREACREMRRQVQHGTGCVECAPGIKHAARARMNQGRAFADGTSNARTDLAAGDIVAVVRNAAATPEWKQRSGASPCIGTFLGLRGPAEVRRIRSSAYEVRSLDHHVHNSRTEE